MLRKKQQNPRLFSTRATEEDVEEPPEDEWEDRFPEVHKVEVKRKGRNTGWESLYAIFTQQLATNDSQGRACKRRVWISYSGGEPTKEELALGWPQEKQKVVRGKLRDEIEHKDYDGPSEFTVTEKRGENGRRFWRETTKELTDKEECRAWDEWMQEENLYDWERIMKKD